MIYHNPPLIMEADRVHDALGVIRLEDLPDPQPRHPLRLENGTPLVKRLWRIALSNAESNIVTTEKGRYFGAGAAFGVRIYTRDISYSGILGLNALYPDVMRQSLQVTRDVRLRIGFKVAKGYAIKAIPAPWQEETLTECAFLKTYYTNSYTRRTDDVVWLWAAEDLLGRGASEADWRWLYETGKQCFDFLYQPFYDATDGLYRGQASFVDIHFLDRKATGYPQNWTMADCVLMKALSTNCLYVKGLRVMAEAAARLGLDAECDAWRAKAAALKSAIRQELRLPDGTFAYYKDRWGNPAARRGALGTAFTVLMGVVTGEEAAAALQGYPVTDAGVPLFHPFFPENNFYHNNTSWPFVDTFFLKALERSEDQEYAALNAALLARTCRPDGAFHEVVDFRDKIIQGSSAQLWTAAAFVDVCRRAGLVQLRNVTPS